MLALLLAATLSLPLIEVPATHGNSDTLVVLVSGDGGWAAIDKSLARTLADHGMPVVGLNSLQYFWSKRTPDVASKDLQSIITTYSTRWNKSRVILLGYSRGADVLPAMFNRMSNSANVRLIGLLSPSRTAEFEFHVSDWLRDSNKGQPVAPELARVREKVLCLWGEDDKDSLCKGLAQSNVHVVTLKGAHHFDGGYDKLAKIILDELQ